MTISTTTRTVAVLTTVLALAACSGGGDESVEKGVLDGIWEDAGTSFQELQSGIDQTRIEELVAQCMTEQGFVYEPVDYSGLIGQVDLTIDRTSEEFVSEYGYGIVSNPSSDAEGGTFADPNGERVQAMSPEEQQQYYQALYGSLNDPEVDPNLLGWEEQGCYGRATNEAGASISNVWHAWYEDLTSMFASIDIDPEVEATFDGWSSCMAGAGWPGLNNVNDAKRLIEQELASIRAEESSLNLGPDASEEDWNAAFDEIAQKREALAKDEVELATADLECRDESGYTSAYAKVSARLQQDFYDEHREEIDAWAASVKAD